MANCNYEPAPNYHIPPCFIHRIRYSQRQIKPVSFHLVSITILIFGSLPTITLGYHMGEVVNLLIKLSSSQLLSLPSINERRSTKNIDALRNQMPRFGISTSTSIDPMTLGLLPTSAQEKLQDLSMTMVFGSEISRLITVYEQEADGRSNKGNYDYEGSKKSGSKILDSLVVKFVYNTHTRHGYKGDIHSISIDEPTYVDFDFRTITQPMEGEKGEEGHHSIKIEYEWVEDADLDMPGGIILMECVTLLTLVFIFMMLAVDGEDENRVP